MNNFPNGLNWLGGCVRVCVCVCVRVCVCVMCALFHGRLVHVCACMS